MTTFLFVTVFGKATVLIGLAALVTQLLSRSSPVARFWIWGLAYVGLAAILVAPAFLPEVAIAVLPAQKTSSAPADALLLTAQEDGPEPRAVSESANRVGAEIDAVAVASRRERVVTADGVVGLVWILGVAFGVLRLSSQLVRLGSLRRHTGVPDARAQMELAGLYRKLGLRGRPDVALADVDVPILCGLLKPAILLPFGARGWSRSTLRTVLLHELIHYRHLDHLTNLGARLIACFYWPNPLVRWSTQAMALERELACDAAVLAAGVERFRYARALVSAARSTCTGPTADVLGMSSDSARTIRKRLRAVLAESTPHLGMTRASLVVSLVVALLVIAPVSTAVLVQGTPSPRPANPSAGALERARAAWALGEREERSAVGRLIMALQDPDPSVRGIAAWALGEIKSSGAVDPLARALDEADDYSREMIVRALGEIEDPRAVPAVSAMLRDPVPAVRSAAVEALQELPTKAAIEAILEAADDESPSVRAKALQALGERGHGSVTSRLVAALGDPVDAVRERAARSLGDRRARAAVVPLVKMLRDPSPSVRSGAAVALGRIGDSRALDGLLRAVRDDHPEVRSSAVWAMDEINPSRS